MAAHSWKVSASRLSARWYRPLNALGCLLLALLAIALLGLTLSARLLSRIQPLSRWLLPGLLVSGSAGFLLFYFAFPAWHSIRFRYLLLWGARLAGALRRSLAAALLLGILVFAFFYIAPSPHKGLNLGATLLLLLKLIALLPLVALLVGPLFTAYRARKSLVILGFSNYTGDRKQRRFVEGFASRLRAELMTISTMYKVFDEAWSSQPRYRIELTPSVKDLGGLLKGVVTPDTKISVGFLHIPLGAVLTAFSRFFQGPRLTGGLHRSSSGLIVVAEVSGGGLAGSWTVRTQDLAAEADLDTSPTPRDAEELDHASLNRLPELLAYQILTDLAPIGSPSWRAVKNYTLGLAAYRETLRTDRDRRLKLYQAEKFLLQSLDEDKTFARCHYNLGIIYRHLENFVSAEAAFRQALQEGHEMVEACLALADTYLTDNRYDESFLFAENALRIQPTCALAWNLAGFAYYKRREQEMGKISPPEQDCKLSIVYQETATALSWRALCAAKACGLEERRPVELAVRCLRDLAVAYSRSRHLRRSESLLGQALHLAPQDRRAHASIQRELGKTQFDRGNFQGALELLKSTSADQLEPEQHARQELRAIAANLRLCQPNRETGGLGRSSDDAKGQHNPGGAAEPWSSGVLVDDKMDSFRTAANDHYYRLLDDSVLISPESREALIEEHWENVGPAMPDYIERLSSAYELLRFLEREKDLARSQKALARLVRGPSEDGDAYATRLVALGFLTPSPDSTALYDAGREFAKLGMIAMLFPRSGEIERGLHQRLSKDLDDIAHDWNWALAQIEVKLAQDTIVDADKNLENAIGRLTADHRGQIRSKGLHGQLGWLYLQLAKQGGEESRAFLDNALLNAERAVHLEPEGPWERTKLAEIYEYLHYFERAEAELRVSLGLKPNDSQTVRLIAVTYWRHGADLLKQEPRRQAFLKATILLSHALALTESEPMTRDTAATQIDVHAWTHFWLGDLYGELMMYGKAIAHLKVALSIGFKPLQAAIDLAFCYHGAKAYAQADAAFLEAWAQARTQHHRTRSSSEHADAPGEEHPLTFLLTQIYLGWALLYADLGVNLEKAEKLTRFAKRRIDRMRDKRKRSQEKQNERATDTTSALKSDALAAFQSENLLQARYHECCGAIHYQRGELTPAVTQLDLALGLEPGGFSYLLLARCRLAEAKTVGKTALKKALRRREQAREACMRARETDVRGEYAAEIAEILDALKVPKRMSKARSERPRSGENTRPRSPRSSSP